MSKIVKTVIAKLEEMKTEEYLCRRSQVLGDLVRDTLNMYSNPIMPDDVLFDNGTIDLEICLSELYAASWSSKDEIDEDFNQLLTKAIKMLKLTY